MAPAYAMPAMLDRAGLGLGDFDCYEIHEAFAAQVLCTLAAWEDAAFCKEKLGREEPLGSIDRAKLNVNGGSLAAGHPFAATGGRIVAGLAKQLHENGGGRGVISICAAGGQGVVAMLGRSRHERPLLAARQRTGRLGDSRRQLGLPRPVPLDRVPIAAALHAPHLRPGAVRRRAGRLASGDGRWRPCSTGSGCRTGRGRRPGEGARLRRDRDRRLDRAGRAAALLSPSGRRAAAQRARNRARHAAGRGRLGRAATAQRALEGFTRSLGKEVGGRGATVQLVLVSRRRGSSSPRLCAFCSRPARPTSPVRWSCSGSAPPAPTARRSTGSAPLDGRVALVTGASRGIGAAIAATLGRDGAKVVGLDVPQAAEELRSGSWSGRRRGDRARHHRRRRPRGDRRAPRRTASTWSSTTPGSPATARSPRCPRSAGAS